MAGVYETWLQSPGLGPNWMHDPVGNAYWGAVGKMLDDQLARMKSGLRSRYPEDAAAMGMADALEQSGQDRMLPRGGTYPGAADETLTAWAARLQDAWNRWEKAGMALGLLLELKAQGFTTGSTGASIVNHIGRRYYLNSSDELVITTPCAECINRKDKTGVVPSSKLTGFTLSAYDQFYSCFFLLFLTNEPYLSNAAGSTGKAILNQTVNRWRQSGARYCGAVVVPVSAGSWVLGWPADTEVGAVDLVIGDNGARFIDTE